MANPDDNEDQIQKVLDNVAAAAARKDLDQVMANYSPSLVAFDLMPPLRQNAADFRKSWETAFSMAKAFGIELRDVSITADSQIGFAHALMHTRVVTNEGKTHDNWLRWTVGLRKIDGAWKIVHEQTSVPVDMEAMKPLMDLQP